MKPVLDARVVALLAVTLLSGSACTSGDGQSSSGQAPEPPPTTDPPPDPPPDPMEGRTYRVFVPSSYDPATPAPLVLMVHQMWPAETAREDMDQYLGITAEAEARGVIVAMPLGTYDETLGSYFWNATDSCCGFYSKPDDVGFIMGMLEEVKAEYNIDEKRVYGIGQSNGSFMVHRLACDFAPQFAAIATLTGATFKDPQRCLALDRVAVLHVHGTADDQVFFDGGPPLGITSLPEAPGAEETVAIWAAKNGCDATPDTSAAPLELVEDLAGAETTRTIYQGCMPNGAAELWAVNGGQHTPLFNSTWSPMVFDFLMAHPKP